jgi:crotonobetainyl-CoA:carnitine CoA-transferase CaiB-like acyl-CoA transferase
MNPTAFSRYRVCDVTTGMVGSMATRWLAAFGAQVVKVEDLSNPDPLRQAGPYRDERRGPELSAAFNNANAGKWGVAIDLGSSRGRRLLTELAAASDVVCLNQRLDDLGLDIDVINQLRPADDPGLIVVEHVDYQLAEDDAQPLASAYCVSSILLALWQREQTDDGSQIDLSRTTGPLLGPATTLEDGHGTVGGVDAGGVEAGGGADSGSAATLPKGIFRCASKGGRSGSNEWVAIECRDEGDRAALKVVMELDDTDLKNADIAIGEWCSGYSRWQVEADLLAVGVPAAAVRRPDERVDADIATGCRQLWPMVDHPEIGGIRIEGIPVELSRTSWSLTESAPLLGQDTHYVLTEMLNLDSNEIERLRTVGVIVMA